jgi:hypothetical protein
LTHPIGVGVLYAQSEKTLSIEQHTWTSVTSASRISSWFLYQQRQLCVWLAAGKSKSSARRQGSWLATRARASGQIHLGRGAN